MSDGQTLPDVSASLVTDESAVAKRRKLSVTRFLYNHNPFYLFSCFLVLYGLQDGVSHRGNLLEQTQWLVGGIAIYTSLMLVTCIAVVRLARVWEDARSIAMVLLIGLVALSAAQDQLCLAEGDLALSIAAISLGFAVFTVEQLLRRCQLRLHLCYRLSVHGILFVFFAFPPVLGYAVRNQYYAYANAGSLLFSICIAVVSLAILPALRQGRQATRKNGTPWSWPAYPLSAFVVLGVMGVIRSHALWMSFGFRGVEVTFEPLLLLPILVALIIMLFETGVSLKQAGLRWTAVTFIPMILVCGLSNDGRSFLPIQNEIRFIAGSASTLTLLVAVLMICYLSVRRMKEINFLIPIGMTAIALVGETPGFLLQVGFTLQIFFLFAGVSLVVVLWPFRHSDWMWTTTSLLFTGLITWCSHQTAFVPEGNYVAGGFAFASCLLIGGLFQTPLGKALRLLAAFGLLGSSSYLCFLILDSSNPKVGLSLLLMGSAIAIAYQYWIRRRAWLGVVAIQSAETLSMIGWIASESGYTGSINWGIGLGTLCFALGIITTSTKTHRFIQWRQRWQSRPNKFVMLPGI
ncbi:MAG: hypothetical protein AAF664_13560 [Planctomycetota bacterium]